MQIVSEIINFFIFRDMNAVQAYKYTNIELKILTSIKLIQKDYNEIRKDIFKNLKKECQNEF